MCFHSAALSVTGDLIPRHMNIFKSNEFFYGVSLPQPDVLEPLENKLPRQSNSHVMDFLKVGRAS
jgi:cyclin-dependent kinase-like